MPITFKSSLSSSVANDTFLDKTIDDAKKGKLSLFKTLITDPDAIDDVQVYINELADTIGQIGEGDPDRKNYANTNYISNGDAYKVSIENLDAQVAVNANNISTNSTNITALTPTTYTNEAVADTSAITKVDNVYKQIRRVSGNAAPITVSSTPFGSSASTLDGLVIILRGTDNTNTVTITNNDIQYGAILNGDAVLSRFDELELMYDSIEERWIEQRRNF